MQKRVHIKKINKSNTVRNIVLRFIVKKQKNNQNNKEIPSMADLVKQKVNFLHGNDT